MATQTLSDIFEAARAHLTDTQVGGGEKFTDDILLPFAQMAVRDLFRTMQRVSNPRILREVYYVLPADTSALSPSTASITDMGEPLILEERGGLTSKTITGATAAASNVSITAASHGFTTGDQITINGIAGVKGTEGLWAITSTGTNTFTINGCVATGTYTSGGVAVKSTEEFSRMRAVTRIEDAGTQPPSLKIWAWMGDVFRFTPSTLERQIRILYQSSATVPTAASDTVAVDDALDFLALRTASLACRVKAPTLASTLGLLAVGPTGEADGSGGLLRDLLISGVRTLQRMDPEERARPPFRESRINSFYL